MHRIPDHSAITLLHIGAEHTEVTVGTGAQADASLELAIGSYKTATRFFRHNPPTPGELEYAIQWVEDEVNRARALVAGHPALWTTDAWVNEMAQLAGVSGTTMSIDAVERLFDLLAALSQGRPAASAGIPNTPAFAATLLVLREFMHHLGFTEIRWTA
jgi:exopolyphosphatase/pppGpp-phosphohydrolase